jgi:hydrogenase maturation protease
MKYKPQAQTLIIGYGNPGRQDDGLGPTFIEHLQVHYQKPLMLESNIRLQANYQLTVEDAYDIAEFEQVVFVDASLTAPPPFSFDRMTATDESGLGSHSLTPNAVIKLCETLYNKTPKAYILGIRGYQFDQFEEQLSSKANHNMTDALAFILSWLSDPNIHQHQRSEAQKNA